MTTPPPPAGPIDAPPAYEPPRLPLPAAWPGVTADWRVHGRDGAALLDAALRFRLDAIVAGLVEGGEPTSAQRDAAMLVLARFDTIHDDVLDPAVEFRLCTSLAPADPVLVEHERLVAFVEDVRIALSGLARGEPVPELALAMPLELEVTSAMLAQQACDLFPAAVTLELTRRDDAGDGAAALLTIEATPALAPPATVTDAGAESRDASTGAGLEQFGRAFEDAFGGALKLACEPGDAGRPPRPWCLRMGDGGVTFGAAGSARWFAPPPLAPRLVDAEGVAESGAVRLSGIDLDESAARLLECVERCFAPAMATAIENEAPAHRARLDGLKARLAGALSARLLPTSADAAAGLADEAAGEPPTAAARATARDTLRAALMESLVAANAACAVGQVELPVQRAHPGAGGARLVGRLASDAPHAALAGYGQLPLAPRDDATAGSFDSPAGVVVVPPPALDRAHLPAIPRLEATAVERTVPADDTTVTMPFVVTTTPGGEPDPALTIALGSLDVPLPLRRVPVAPAIAAQRATGAHAPASIAEARRWTRTVTIAAPLTAHDVLRVEMRHAPGPFRSASDAIGGATAVSDEPMPAPRALADALAPFLAEQEELMAPIERLLAGDPGDEQRRAALRALDRLIALGDGVAARWAELPPVATATRMAPPPEAQQGLHAYELAFGDDADAGAAPVVTPGPTPPSPDSRRLRVRRWSAGSGWPEWPTIEGWSRELPPASPVSQPAGATGQDLAASGAPPQDAWYHRDPAARDARANARWTLAFGGLDVLSHRNADIVAQVVRNANGASGAGAATAPAFRMESERSSTPAPVPRLDIGPVAIDDLPGGTLPEVLGALCAALVAPDESALALRVAARYSYTPSPRAAGPGEMRVALPILLASHLPMGPADGNWRDPASAAAQLAARMGEWFRATRPSTSGARLELEVSLLDGDDARALLHFESLTRQVPPDPAWWGSGP